MWKTAMIACLLLIIMQRAGGFWAVHKLRTWAAMMLSSLWGMAAVSLTGDYTPVILWIIGDCVAGLIVIMRPAGLAQKAIGFSYLMLVLYHIGFLLSGGKIIETYIEFQIATGWAQIAVLLLWSVADVGRHIGHRIGVVSNAPVIETTDGAAR